MESFLTISVDDGHPTDLRTVDLLHKHGLKATFYIPGSNPERPMMSPSEIVRLAASFDIGSHTLNNARLKSLSPERLRSEVNDGKKWLEDLLGVRAISFCYPGGKFNARVASMVEQAGFLGARTCMLNLVDFPSNPFYWGVSTHACSHRVDVQVRHALLEGNFSGAWNFLNVCKATADWARQFMYALEHVSKRGGIAHLYMHSWEIDRYDEWNKLEAVFRATSRYETLIRVTNGQLYELWHRRHSGSRSNTNSELQPGPPTDFSNPRDFASV